MLSKADISKRVLQRLTVLENGQTPDPDDDALVQSKYVGLHGELQRKELVSWPVNSIPEWAEHEVVSLLASRLVNDFMVPDDVLMVIRSDALAAPRELSRLQKGKYTPETIPVEYF